jgi:hypothetical protein
MWCLGGSIRSFNGRRVRCRVVSCIISALMTKACLFQRLAQNLFVQLRFSYISPTSWLARAGIRNLSLKKTVRRAAHCVLHGCLMISVQELFLVNLAIPNDRSMCSKCEPQANDVG